MGALEVCSFVMPKSQGGASITISGLALFDAFAFCCGEFGRPRGKGNGNGNVEGVTSAEFALGVG